MPKSFTPTGNYAQNQALRKEIAELKAKGYRKPDNFPPVKPGSVKVRPHTKSTRLGGTKPGPIRTRKGVPLMPPKHLFNKQSRIEDYIKPFGPPKPRSHFLA